MIHGERRYYTEAVIVMAKEKNKEQKLSEFERTVSHYEAALLRYASRLLCDQSAAQDIVQDTFIKLFKRWQEEMEPSPKLSSWLYRVTHNGAVDYLRKVTRKRELHKKHASERPDSIPPNRGDGFRISESAAHAAAALEILDLRERQLVVLKVYEEKSYKEIADITGLTTSNVGYILHHAMKKMAAELKKVGTR